MQGINNLPPYLRLSYETTNRSKLEKIKWTKRSSQRRDGQSSVIIFISLLRGLDSEKGGEDDQLQSFRHHRRRRRWARPLCPNGLSFRYAAYQAPLRRSVASSPSAVLPSGFLYSSTRASSEFSILPFIFFS